MDSEKLAIDHSVLRTVRSGYGFTWTDDFTKALNTIWKKRNGKYGVTVGDNQLYLLYETGDYSQAQADAINMRPANQR